MKEDQKQKIRAIDFNSHKSSPILECEVDAIGNGNCFKCGNPGHIANNCGKGLTCFNCGKGEHYARDCPEPKKETKPKVQDKAETASKTNQSEIQAPDITKLLEAVSQLIKQMSTSTKPEYHNRSNSSGTQSKTYFKNKYDQNKKSFTKVNEIDDSDNDTETVENSSENEKNVEAAETAPKN
jgi:hypothetical protein